MNRETLVLGAALLLALSTAACGLSSMRTAEMGDSVPDAASERRGRALLESALAASGGRACWDSYPVAELTLEDEWRGFIGQLFRPWPGNPTRLQVHYELDMRAVEATILSKKERGRQFSWNDREKFRTRLIEIVQYTIRDKVSWAKGVNFFSDFRTVGGLTIPHRYTIFRHLNDKQLVHRAQINDLHFDHGDRPVSCEGVD